MICVLFSVSYAQQKVEVRLGTDKKGTSWFTLEKFIEPIKGQRYMTAMFTNPGRDGSHVALFAEVDCSDNTMRFHGMDSYFNYKKVNSLDETTDWARPAGVAIKLYEFVCTKKGNRLIM